MGDDRGSTTVPFLQPLGMLYTFDRFAGPDVALITLKTYYLAQDWILSHYSIMRRNLRGIVKKTHKQIPSALGPVLNHWRRSCFFSFWFQVMSHKQEL